MRRERGSVFVTSLASLAGLVAVLAVIASAQRSEVVASTRRVDALRARLAAMSAVQRALVELNPGTQQPTSTSTTPATGLANQNSAPTTNQDAWATLGDNGDTRFVVGNATFRMQVVDLSARIDLNTASEELLRRLPLTEEQIQSLLDWRSQDRNPRPLGGKDEYYNALETPYNAKLRRIDTFDELLLIKGFTPVALFDRQNDAVPTAAIIQGSTDQQPTLYDLVCLESYQPQVNPQGQAKLNVNSPGVNAAALRRLSPPLPNGVIVQIAGRKNWTGIGELCGLPGLGPNDRRTILDNLTTDGALRIEGRVNLNTASQEVLTALPGFTPDLVQAVISRQGQGFATLGDVTTLPGMTPEVLRQCADLLAVASNTFLVRAVGRSGETEVVLEAIVDIQLGVPRLIKVTDALLPDMPARWGWNDEPTGETVVVENQ